MNRTIKASLTRTHRGDPLASIEGLPGDGADLTPGQLRALAATLVSIAADTEAHARQAQPRRGAMPPSSRTYPLCG